MKKFVMTLGVMAAMAFGHSAQAQTSDATLKRFKETGELTIGHRDSAVPFSYVDQSRGPIGFTLDLCREIVTTIATDIGVKKSTINYVPVTPQNRIILLQNGTIDLECGSTSNTLDREKQVAFSVSIFKAGVRMVVLRDSGITKFADLRDKKIGSTSGSTADDLIKLNAAKLGFKPNILYAKDEADAFLAVITGRAAAYVEGDILLAGLIANSKDPKKIAIVGEALRNDPYGIMIRREDEGLKKALDAELMKMMANGRFAQLYTTWFERPIPPHNINLNFPMSDSVRGLVAHPNDVGQ